MTNHSQTERRKYKRVETMLSADVQIFLPEETDHTEVKKALIENIGEEGMKLTIADVPLELYRKLMSAIRRAKISFVLPNTYTLKKLIGKMVWLDYYKDKADCTCGIYFESIHPRDKQDLSDLIERLERHRYQVQ